MKMSWQHIRIRSASNLFFLVTTLGLFFGLTFLNIYNFLGYKGIVKKIDDKQFRQIIGRSPVWYIGPDEGRFFSGVFQDNFEKATADHFPFFAILTYKKIQRFLNTAFLYPLPHKITPLLPLGGRFSLVKDCETIVEHPETIADRNIYNKLFKRAEYYNGIIKEFPGITLIIMPIMDKFRWFMKAYYPKLNFYNPNGNNLIELFRSMIDPKIIYSVAFRDILQRKH